MPKCKGFTFVELLVSVTLIVILSALAIPSFIDFIVRMRVDNEISTLYRLLSIARNTAINSGQRVTVCPLNLSNNCSTKWHEELTVFIDLNANNRFDASNNETILKVKSATKVGDKLEYGLNRNRVVYAPTGRTTGWGSNGTFKYCPKDHENKSRGIIVATSGRVYASADNDNDGKDENRNNKEIACNN